MSSTSAADRCWRRITVEGPGISAYGVLAGSPDPENRRIYNCTGMVEKPKFEDAPSKQAIIGRYVLTPRIFELLEQTTPGAGGEIQLTDGIKALLKEEKVFGYTFEGKRFDAGDKFGMLQATVEFALKRPDLGDAVPRVSEEPAALSSGSRQAIGCRILAAVRVVRRKRLESKISLAVLTPPATCTASNATTLPLDIAADRRPLVRAQASRLRSTASIAARRSSPVTGMPFPGRLPSNCPR